MSDYFIDKVMVLATIFFLLYHFIWFIFRGRYYVKSKYIDNKKKQKFYLRLGWGICILAIVYIIAMIIVLIIFF